MIIIRSTRWKKATVEKHHFQNWFQNCHQHCMSLINTISQWNQPNVNGEIGTNEKKYCSTLHSCGEFKVLLFVVLLGGWMDVCMCVSVCSSEFPLI